MRRAQSTRLVPTTYPEMPSSSGGNLHRGPAEMPKPTRSNLSQDKSQRVEGQEKKTHQIGTRPRWTVSTGSHARVLYTCPWNERRSPRRMARYVSTVSRGKRLRTASFAR